MSLVRQWASRITAGGPGSKDLQGCLSVLPILRAQLTETAQHIEQAVVGVCASFSAIAMRARQAVAKTTELLGDNQQDQDATVERSIETSRSTIAGLLDRMERATRLSSMAVSNMAEIENTVLGIESLLVQVQKIAFTNKVVALNAKIEAVHVGELGSGFEVVADEISGQADHSEQLTAGIAERIREMRVRVNSATNNLREFLAEDREKLDQSRHDAETALSLLWSLHQRARESLERMSGENTRLAAEISDAVVGLQFQDRVNQRMAHVIEAIERIEAAMQHRRAFYPARAGAPALLDEVHRSYTMQSERVVHAGSADLPQPANPDMEVELF